MKKQARRRKERKGLHLSWEERMRIEDGLKKKKPIKEIAKEIGCCRATIYNEIRRATYEHTENDLSTTTRYSPDAAQDLYDKSIRRKGQMPKLLMDPEQREYLGRLMIEEEYSPAAALMQAQKDGMVFQYPVTSVRTIYDGIAKGYFDGLNLEMLPDKGWHRSPKKHRKRVKRAKSVSKGTSIDKRPEQVEDREEFGHWEMDTVIGQAKNKKSILVLTERKTRTEIMELLNCHTTDAVRRAINRLEKRFGSAFYKIFKSISVDNGPEFKDFESMEKALYRVGERTCIYYCHPHCPHERGTNEVTNKMVRRTFPKGGNFDKILNKKALKQSEYWINHYPRASLGGLAAIDCFTAELQAMGYENNFFY